MPTGLPLHICIFLFKNSAGRIVTMTSYERMKKKEKNSTENFTDVHSARAIYNACVMCVRRRHFPNARMLSVLCVVGHARILQRRRKLIVAMYLEDRHAAIHEPYELKLFFDYSNVWLIS